MGYQNRDLKMELSEEQLKMLLKMVETKPKNPLTLEEVQRFIQLDTIDDCHNRVHGSHYAHMHKPAPAPAMGHRNAPMHDNGHMGNHNMGNHKAPKAPNREVAMNTHGHSNHGHSNGGRR